MAKKILLSHQESPNPCGGCDWQISYEPDKHKVIYWEWRWDAEDEQEQMTAYFTGEGFKKLLNQFQDQIQQFGQANVGLVEYHLLSAKEKGGYLIYDPAIDGMKPAINYPLLIPSYILLSQIESKIRIFVYGYKGNQCVSKSSEGITEESYAFGQSDVEIEELPATLFETFGLSKQPKESDLFLSARRKKIFTQARFNSVFSFLDLIVPTSFSEENGNVNHGYLFSVLWKNRHLCENREKLTDFIPDFPRKMNCPPEVIYIGELSSFNCNCFSQSCVSDEDAAEHDFREWEKAIKMIITFSFCYFCSPKNLKFKILDLFEEVPEENLCWLNLAKRNYAKFHSKNYTRAKFEWPSWITVSKNGHYKKYLYPQNGWILQKVSG